MDTYMILMTLTVIIMQHGDTANKHLAHSYRYVHTHAHLHTRTRTKFTRKVEKSQQYREAGQSEQPFLDLQHLWKLEHE